jgi:hypothetical protein
MSACVIDARLEAPELPELPDAGESPLRIIASTAAC